MRPLDPRVLQHLRPARRPLLGVLAGGLFGGLLTVAQAFAMGALVVRVVEDPAGSTWHEPAWWLAAIIAARAAAAFIVDTSSATAATRVSLPLRRRLLESALALDAQALSRRRTGELALLATRGMVAIEPYLTRYLTSMVLAVVLPVATVAAIFWLDWTSGLIVLFTLPLVPVFAILIGLTTRDRADRQWRQLSTLSGHFLDVVRGLPTLVAYRRARAQSASIRQITERYRVATVETLKVAFASSAVMELVATISVALVAVSVGLRLAAGNIEFETAMIVLLLAPEAYWPLRRVGAEFHAAAEGTAAFEHADALLGLAPGGRSSGLGDPARPRADAEQSGVESSDRQPSGIQLTGLTLGYADRDRPVLRELSAQIPATGLTAVVGPSGCGKTTLLSALTAELPVASGRILVDGVDLASLDPEDWRARFAWMGQRPWLTAGTIADNLRVADPDASDDRLWSALEQVALGPTVRDLSQGLETPLGEDGAGLSAGQRARLALARVVLADRPFVFLDEPTAHLDAVTESVLLETLRDLAHRSCVVVVAHRPAVVEAADHVLPLPAEGSHLVTPHHPDPAHRSQEVTPHHPDPGDTSPDVTSRPVDPADTSQEVTPRRWGVRTGIVLGTLSVGAGVALTATASWLITRASLHPPVLTLMVAIVAVRTFGLARPVLRYAERIVSHDAALRMLAEQRAQVYDALVPLVPGRLGRHRGDVLTSVVDDVDSVVDRELRVRQPAWTALGVSLLATCFATAATPVAGAVILLVCLVGGLGGLLAFRGVSAAEADFIQHRAALSTRVEAIVHSARSLVLWRATAPALADVDAAGADLARATRRSSRAVATGRTLPLLAGAAGMFALAGFVPLGAVSPAMLALLLMLPIALVDALAPLPDAGALAVRTAAAQGRLAALEAIEPLVTDPADPQQPAGPRTAQARQVAAGWGERPAFEDLSMVLTPGARIGLVGASGTGKSTYAAVMLRFLDPSTGSQELAGVDLRQLTLDDVRRLTGLVDDDPHIFGSTVLENVRLARPEATDEEVLAALDAAHLGTWVRGLPSGARTTIGAGSAHVSGGERARIAVARALLADQPVLVLDEPTAHLDADTARRISAEILNEERGCSIVWITHGTIGLDAMDAVIRLGETEIEPVPVGYPAGSASTLR